jgi:hypothetical protein
LPELKKLRKENELLEKRLKRAEIIIEVQKKVSQMQGSEPFEGSLDSRWKPSKCSQSKWVQNPLAKPLVSVAPPSITGKRTRVWPSGTTRLSRALQVL